MQDGEKWAIKKSDGELLQSFTIDPAQISIGWYCTGALGKTKEGKKGPLTFQSLFKAQSLLTTLNALIPKEFADAEVASFEMRVADKQSEKNKL